MDEKDLEIERLRNAIRSHRDQKRDARCWLDDRELYKVLPEDVKAETVLPPKDFFLASCERYWKECQHPKDKSPLDCPETELEYLKQHSNENLARFIVFKKLQHEADSYIKAYERKL